MNVPLPSAWKWNTEFSNKPKVCVFLKNSEILTPNLFLDLGITLITIAHNKELRRHHTHLLRFDGAGLCSFGPIEDLLEEQQEEQKEEQEEEKEQKDEVEEEEAKEEEKEQKEEQEKEEEQPEHETTVQNQEEQ